MALVAELGWRRLLGQALILAVLAAWLGYCSNQPPYRHLAGDLATIKLSLRHAGQILGECRERSAEELAGLPANMRIALVCPRERSPLLLELEVNGETVYSEVLPPRGIHGDGRVSVYQRLPVPAGEVDVRVRLKDRLDADDFPYRSHRRLTLEPGANLVIDFDGDRGAFSFLNGEKPVVLEEGAPLEHALDDLEAGDRQHQYDHEVDEAPVGQGLAALRLDEAHDPVGEEVQPHGHHGKDQNLLHFKSLAGKPDPGIVP